MVYDAGVKFTRFLAPQSLDYLNFRTKIKALGCPRCRCPSAVVSHGYLPGCPVQGDGRDTRGMRFLCSDRYSNPGCGGTFSVHWETVIPLCTLHTLQLLGLVRAVAGGRSIHQAWYFSGLTFSLSTAYRWIARWLKLTARIRTALCTVAEPPGKSDGRPDPYTLDHLAVAFPQSACAIAAFQSGLQASITG